MEQESQTMAMIANWLFFFALTGGAIFSGVRFSKLALNFGYNRYLFGFIGVALYLSLFRGYAMAMGYIAPGPGWTKITIMIAAVIATTAGIYMLLKNSWAKRGS